MTEPIDEREPIEELEQLLEEYHHIQSEHRRSGIEGTGRRHLHRHLDELEHRFEWLLETEIATQEARDVWRERLHHGLPLEAVEALPPALLFKGRAETGSTVEVRAHGEDEADVLLDGVPIDRLGGEMDFETYEADGRVYTEVFDAAPEALTALRDWVADPSGPAPVEHVQELHADGLVDRHLGLTARGHRYLELASGG